MGEERCGCGGGAASLLPHLASPSCSLCVSFTRTPAMRTRFIPLVIAATSITACIRALEEPADLIVVGGTVYTSDTAQWTAEAIAVKQGRVVFVGSRRDAMAYRGDSTTVEDVNGATVLAGLVDAHAHVV